VSLFDSVARQRRLVYLVVFLLCAGGVVAALRLPSAIYPEVKFPYITVVAQGTALAPDEMVFGVTRPLEQAASAVPGVQRVSSKTIRGASELRVLFAPKTDMLVALQLLQSRVAEVRSDLPPELDITVERMLPSVFPILTYNLLGPDPAKLYDIARYEIKPALSRIPGVGPIEVQGDAVPEIEVIAEPTRLGAAGLTYEELANLLRDALGVSAIGRVESDYKQLLVITDNAAHSADEVAAIVLPGGLRVGEIANVVRGTQDRVSLFRGDGKPAVLINVARQPEGNTLQVADGVAREMEALAKTLPEGVTVQPVYDQANFVREGVHSVRDAIITGSVLVVLVLLLFLRAPRITVISALTIPIALIISVFVMQLLGQTFNLMSLGGMAIAVGLVIDDAVVVTENIVRHMAMKSRRHEAIRDAVQELTWPVTTSTLTTVVVFMPLGLLQGVVGQFFAALSITLVSAVLVSLVLAFTLVPALCDDLLAERGGNRAADEPGGERKPDRLVHWATGVAHRYESALRGELRHPGWIVLIIVLLVGGGMAVARFVPTGFLPVMDEGAFVLDYWTPGGTALSETDRELGLVEDILNETPEVAGSSRRTGAEMGLFATQQNTGDVVVRLKPRGERSRDIFAVMDEVRTKAEARVPRLRVEFIQLLSDVIGDLAGNPNPLEIKLFGDRLDQLEAYGREIAQELEQVDGVVDLYDGVAEHDFEVRMHVDESAAARAGFTPEAVATQVSAALLGASAGVVRVGQQPVGVRVHAPDAMRFDPDRLGALPLSSPTGTELPLSAVATLRNGESRSELLRENQRPMVMVTGGVEGNSLRSVMASVRRILADHPAPQGVRVELGGQYASQRAAFVSLMLVLGVAALCVIAVMLVQFESFVEPLIILLVAPLSFVGAAGLLLLTGTPLNVSSIMGMILLVGLVVKNGILLLDFTRYRMRFEHENLGVAIAAAARTRLRPILMTTLATLVALLPLALGIGAGAEQQRPLALAVLGGLALSTPITLFIVPALTVLVRGRNYTITEG
jgi:CzcA family heavy metal efflux pump